MMRLKNVGIYVRIVIGSFICYAKTKMQVVIPLLWASVRSRLEPLYRRSVLVTTVVNLAQICHPADCALRLSLIGSLAGWL